MNKIKIPKTFYHYCRFNENSINLLCKDLMFFSKPSLFNDPFDCKPFLNNDSSLSELRKLLAYFIKRKLRAEMVQALSKAHIRPKSAESHIKKHVDSETLRVLKEIAYQATNPDYEISVEQAEKNILLYDIQNEIIAHYERGVCCFSSTYKNPLLWSHYGDQHKGLCIGYTLDRIPKPIINKINYSGSRIINTSILVDAFLNGNKEANEVFERQIFLRKASSWSYECEWRMIGKQGIQESPLRLKEIIFGLRCPTSIIFNIYKMLKKREKHIAFYEINEVQGSFRLKRNKYYFDELDVNYPNTAESAEEMFDNFDS